MEKLYKVVDIEIFNDVHVDTDIVNYSSTLTKAKELKDFIDIMTIKTNCSIPISVLATINKGAAMYGQDYLQMLLQRSKNGFFTGDQITNQNDDKKFLIKESDIVYFIENVARIGFIRPFEGCFIWGYLFEEARQIINPESPKREESFFLFETILDCERYIKEYKANGKICQVELVDVKKTYRADMNILNEIPNNYTPNVVLRNAIKYWNEVSSTNPFYEILFQGKCILKPL